MTDEILKFAMIKIITMTIRRIRAILCVGVSFHCVYVCACVCVCVRAGVCSYARDYVSLWCVCVLATILYLQAAIDYRVRKEASILLNLISIHVYIVVVLRDGIMEVISLRRQRR